MDDSRIVITFGTFDCFHIGHVNILRRAKSLGYLVVGVSTDKLNRQKKKSAIFSESDRLAIVKQSCYVDEVFYEESLELKREYILKYHANILVMGDDWKGVFDDMPCQVIYFERTPDISTTLIKQAAAVNWQNRAWAKSVNCFCYNYTYLIPILEILKSFGVELVFYYVRELPESTLTISERFISYCQMKLGPITYHYLEYNQISTLTDKNLGIIGLNHHKTVGFGHGIDEEECIISLLSEDRKSFTINQSLLTFHQTIVNREQNKHLFNKIYHIDTTKPTIIFSDGYNCPFIITYITEYETKQADHLLDVLIKLKEKYNVVIRFHPFMETGYKLSKQFPDKLVQNFIVDFTPFNNYFLYTQTEVLITTRYTSSGYQALFSDLAKIVFLDFDYDRRKYKYAPTYLSKINNSMFETWMNDKEIISNHHINVISETQLDLLYDTIILDQFHYDKKAIDQLFLKKYGFDHQKTDVQNYLDRLF